MGRGDVIVLREFPTVTAQSLDPDRLTQLPETETVSRIQLPFGEPCWLVGVPFDDRGAARVHL